MLAYNAHSCQVLSDMWGRRSGRFILDYSIKVAFFPARCQTLSCWVALIYWNGRATFRYVSVNTVWTYKKNCCNKRIIIFSICFRWALNSLNTNFQFVSRLSKIRWFAAVFVSIYHRLWTEIISLALSLTSVRNFFSLRKLRIRAIHFSWLFKRSRLSLAALFGSSFYRSHNPHVLSESYWQTSLVWCHS